MNNIPGGIKTNFSNYSINTDDIEKNEVSNFTELLKDNISSVNETQVKADEKTTKFVSGQTDNIHKVTIATEKARLAMDLTVAIQNKVLDAYEEMMRIQV